MGIALQSVFACCAKSKNRLAAKALINLQSIFQKNLF